MNRVAHYAYKYGKLFGIQYGIIEKTDDYGNCIAHYFNGKEHRTDGPARIYYYSNGIIEGKTYYINDEVVQNRAILNI